MWNCAFGIIFTVFISGNIVELRKLPSYITPCNRSDQTFLQCVEKNVEVLKTKLKEGIPDLFIPSVNPLVIPPTTVNEDDRVKVIFKDIQIFHADQFHVDQFDIDLKHHIVNLTVTFPQLRIKSNYNVNGKFLGLTFNENGPADGNYTNFQVHLGLKGTSYFTNELEYLKWEKETISINIDKSQVVLENLFGNHTDIKNEINKVINENIDTIINDLQPVLQKVVSEVVFNVIDKLFSNYSVNELFVN